MPFARIEDAVAAFARGEILVVVDDEDRENEGDLIMAAEFATPESVAFFLHHTSGYLCAPITAERAAELDLPPMVVQNTESQRTAFLITVDYRHGTSTGHLRLRPLRHRAGAVRPGHPTRRPGPARPHQPADGAGGRRARSGPATPRPPSTSASSPVSTRPGCSARSSTTRRPTWPGCRSSSGSPPSTTC